MNLSTHNGMFTFDCDGDNCDLSITSSDEVLVVGMAENHEERAHPWEGIEQ